MQGGAPQRQQVCALPTPPIPTHAHTPLQEERLLLLRDPATHHAAAFDRALLHQVRVRAGQGGRASGLPYVGRPGTGCALSAHSCQRTRTRTHKLRAAVSPTGMRICSTPACRPPLPPQVPAHENGSTGPLAPHKLLQVATVWAEVRGCLAVRL